MALYNQSYPQQFNNPYQPYIPPVQSYSQNTQPDNTGIVWVQGESGAKAYPVQPGKSVVLFDSESEHFFIKTTDISGMPQPLRVFTYSEASENDMRAPSIDTSNFITREEFEEALEKLRTRQASQNTYQRKDGGKNGKPLIQRTNAE